MAKSPSFRTLRTAQQYHFYGPLWDAPLRRQIAAFTNVINVQHGRFYGSLFSVLRNAPPHCQIATFSGAFTVQHGCFHGPLSSLLKDAPRRQVASFPDGGRGEEGMWPAEDEGGDSVLRVTAGTP